MNERILVVDDDANLLAACKRRLRKQFRIHTALGPRAALRAVETGAPCAVIMCDLGMPEMDGITLLEKVREIAPDTVRVMLTGEADIAAAVAAVNDGNVFRFLIKPAQTDALIKALSAALDQHRLLTAQRELIEKTLRWTTAMLTEALALANPAAFGRVLRLRGHVRRIVDRLGLAGGWQFEAAAMLSHVGGAAFPTATRPRRRAAGVGDLAAQVPRIEAIVEMVARQENASPPAHCPRNPRERDPIELGANILKVVAEFDRCVAAGESPDEATARLRSQADDYDPAIVRALGGPDGRRRTPRSETWSGEPLRVAPASLESRTVPAAPDAAA